ncbi:hypothetical protein [Kordiimonas sp.]|uniref:hypothetical protein n=1 Tax=Kordiimonas sp. TaxID=1970157 RepID=UPI003A919A8A
MIQSSTFSRPGDRRAFADTAREIARSIPGDGRPPKDMLIPVVEARMVSAAWTLRRLPDRERGFLRARQSYWPETMADGGTYAGAGLTSFQARFRARIRAEEIDAMQPTLDLLLLLPDREDREILFFGAWHQDGELGGRIPWAKVRRSLPAGKAGNTGNLSRWTLKRRYAGALSWLAALIALQL